MTVDSLTVTNIIIGITALISFMLMQDQVRKSILIFHPFTIRRQQQWYRFLSSGLIHADFMHLGINMFVLWSFGNALETYFYPAFLGDFVTAKYLVLYLGGIIVASIPSYFRHQNNPAYAALGASGSVSAVVFAVILFAPWDNLYLYGVIAIPQILAGVIYLSYSWYKDKRANDNIGHMAHLTGALWGLGFSCIMNPNLLSRFVELTLRGPNW